MDNKNELETAATEQCARKKVVQLIQENWNEDSSVVAGHALAELLCHADQEMTNELTAPIFKYSNYCLCDLAMATFNLESVDIEDLELLEKQIQARLS